MKRVHISWWRHYWGCACRDDSAWMLTRYRDKIIDAIWPCSVVDVDSTHSRFRHLTDNLLAGTFERSTLRS